MAGTSHGRDLLTNIVSAAVDRTNVAGYRAALTDLPTQITDAGLNGDSVVIGLDMFERMFRLYRENKLIPEPPPVEYEEFPLELLPRTVREYTINAAKALSVHPDYLLPATLSTLAAGIGNSYHIQIKRAWTQPCTLWTGLVAPSGSNKTQSVMKPTAPIGRLESRAYAEYKQRKQNYEDELADLEKGQKPISQEPHQRRYKMAELTIEALHTVHELNPHGIIVIRDELSGWMAGMGKYKQGGDEMQQWAEIHAGGQFTRDRSGQHGVGRYIDNPHICITGGIQPDILETAFTPEMLSLGMLARFTLFYPPSQPLLLTDADIHPDDKARYHKLIERLYNLDSGEIKYVPLTSNAFLTMKAFTNENARRNHQLPEGPLRSFCSKLPGLAARIALILHLTHAVETGAPEIIGSVKEETVAHAWTITDWIRRENTRIYTQMGWHTLAIDTVRTALFDLPERFTIEDMKKVFKCSQATAYRKRKQFEKRGLAREIRGTDLYEKI